MRDWQFLVASFFSLFMSWSALFMSWSALANEDVRPLILGSTIDPPLKWLEGDVPRGFDVDLLNEILPLAGVSKFQFAFFDGTARNLEEAKGGRVDLIVTLSKKPDREVYLDYPKESHIEIKWQFVIRATDKDRIKFETFDDLKGLELGVVDAIAYADTLPATLKYQVTQVERNLFPMLLANRIDVIPMVATEAAYKAKMERLTDKIHILPKPFRTALYYYPWSKNSDYPDKALVMNKMDEILARKREDGSLSDLYNRYVSLTQ